MMRQAAAPVQSMAAPDEILTALAGGSFLVAAPAPTAAVPHGRLSCDDAELLRAVRAYLACRSRRSAPGDSERGSWEIFYEQYDPVIRRVVRSWRLSEADADDCVQEVWAELIAKLGDLGYDPQKGRFRSWLFTFARRKVSRFLRRKRRVLAQPLADPAKVADRDGDPTIASQRREAGEAVHRMLSALRGQVSDINYRVLHLRWIDGRSSTEIAAQVDMTQDQVRWRLQRMQRKLRKLIATRTCAHGTDAPPRR